MNRKVRKSKTPNVPALVPPATRIQPIQRRIFRYSGVSGSAVVTGKSILSIAAFNNSAATTAARCLFEGVRLRRLRVWAVDTTSPQTVTVVWFGAGPGDRISATGNQSFPARIDVKPPKGSAADFWQEHSNSFAVNSGASTLFPNLFSISANCAYIVDAHVDTVLENGACATLVTTGATIGAVSYPNLDCLDQAGTSAGTALLTPVGLTAVTTVTSRTE